MSVPYAVRLREVQQSQTLVATGEVGGSGVSECDKKHDRD